MSCTRLLHILKNVVISLMEIRALRFQSEIPLLQDILAAATAERQEELEIYRDLI